MYTLKTIQNEMIAVIGDAIRCRIINEIKKAKYFTILADKVTDCANLEHLSIVIRFVDEEMQIRERNFLTSLLWKE